MKRGRIFVVVGLILLAVLFSRLYRRYCYSPLGQFVLDLYFEGIILDPAEYPVNPPYTGAWKVTPSEIREMESELATHIQRNKRMVGKRISAGLRSYKRYYLGLLDADGTEFIEISFCHADVTNRNGWLQYYSETVGGGDYYWHITYHVHQRTFRDFFPNEPD